MTLRTRATITRLVRDMAFAAMEYEANPTYRRRINAEWLAQGIFEADLSKGLISRPEPRAEWVDWPTGRGAR